MAKDRNKGKRRKGNESGHEMVPVIYARSLTEAEFYKGLLTANDIPAMIEDEAGEVIGMPSSIVGQGVPVLVPDEMLDEASEIIAEHEDSEEDEELDEYEDVDDEGDEDLDDDDLDEDDEFDDDDLDEDDDLGDLDTDLDDEDGDDLDDFDEDEESERP